MPRVCSCRLTAAIGWLALTLLTSPSYGETAAPLLVPEFQLPGIDGGLVKVAKGQAHQVTVVCFLGAECPVAKLYGPRLAAFAEEFGPQGVRFVAVSSNQQDSLDDMREYAQRHGIPFAVAKDYGNVVADMFAAQRTPHVFVLDEDLVIRYRGRIDDQFLPGIKHAAPSREDLRIAIEEVLAGKPVSVPATEPMGCFIGREKRPIDASEVTFTNQVSRVLNTHCVECHRPGEIGPFSLTDYEEVVGWADMILEVIDDGRMPPWHASPEHGQFANARHMPQRDREILHEWVEAGTPYGDAAELPERRTFVDGWLLPREPDLVLPMRDRPFVVPATGTVEYQYFVVDPGFTEDRWVTAAQVVPGNRSVVHHSIVFIRPPDGEDFRGVGWLSGYVPGQRPYAYPPGTARRVPAGSKLVFQMHYTPTGAEESDTTRIGIVFADADAVSREAVTLIAIDHGFEIPPGESNYQVEASVRRMPEEGELLSIMPHMHYRGKSFKLFVEGDDRRDLLLHVPRYDFNWQHNYQLTEPLPLAGVEDLECSFTFDNAEDNPFNPDPTQYVTWGDQTWEEMAIAFFDVSVPRDNTSSDAETVDETPVRPEKLDAVVQRFMRQFDSNGDGLVEPGETPASMRVFGFSQLDGDGDDCLSREEIRQLARQRLMR